MNLSWVLDLIETFLPLTGEPVLDTVLSIVIGVIAFRIAWAIAGQVECNSFWMSVIHWAIRIVGFVVLWFLCSGLYWFIRLLCLIPWWAWIIVGAFVAYILLLVIMLAIIKRTEKKKEDKKHYEN